MTLKTTVITGWPELREQVPIPIREYWLYRDEISVHNRVLFKNHWIIVPKLLWAEILSRIHSSHLGAESCLRKDRDIVFWPGTSNEIKESAANCQIFVDFQARNPRQPLQTHEIPDRPWSRVAADLFSLRGKNHIVLVDYYSNFLEVSELPDTSDGSVIQFLKEQSIRHGVPDCLVTDNGSQIVSQEFIQSFTDREFKHVTSSPRYPKSNGKAESAVKVAKKLFKKAIKDGKDPWSALLDYRNTPTEGMKSSPAQRLMSRRTLTLLPTATGLLHPKVVDRRSWRPDQTEETEGQVLSWSHIQTSARNRGWAGSESSNYRTQQAMEECNVCAEAIRPFLLVEDLEKTQSLNPTPTPKPAKSYPMPPSHAVEETVQISPEAVSITCTSSGTQQAPTETHSTTSTSEKAPVASVSRTSTRFIKPPSRYQDFVKT